MPRRNQGPRLRWLDKRQCFYITWTEHGRSRERSTGTANREQAEAIFGEWLQSRGRRTGPRNPDQVLVTEVLTEYALWKADEVIAPRMIGCAIAALAPFWESRSVAEITKQSCKLYAKHRGPDQRTPSVANSAFYVRR